MQAAQTHNWKLTGSFFEPSFSPAVSFSPSPDSATISLTLPTPHCPVSECLQTSWLPDRLHLVPSISCLQACRHTPTWCTQAEMGLACSLPHQSCSAKHHQSSDFKCNESCCSSLPVCVGVGSRVAKGFKRRRWLWWVAPCGGPLTLDIEASMYTCTHIDTVMDKDMITHADAWTFPVWTCGRPPSAHALLPLKHIW